VHALRPRVSRVVHLHRLAQGDDPGDHRGRQGPDPQRAGPVRHRLLDLHVLLDLCRGLPVHALHWSPEFEYSELDIRELTHEKDRLREWMWTVPAPVALDDHAEPAKEIGVAQKAAERAAARPEDSA
jgi:hypothetical protein